MRTLTNIKLALLIALMLPSSGLSFQQGEDQKIHIIGTVIGRWNIGGVILIPGGTVPEYILVRVDKSSGNLQAGQFIQVSYEYSSKENEKLPGNFYKQMKQWEFTLARVEGDDQRQMLDIIYSKSDREGGGKLTPILKRVAGAENEYLPLHVTVPLYEAELGSIKNALITVFNRVRLSSRSA